MANLVVLICLVLWCSSEVLGGEVLFDRWRELDSGRPLGFNETYELISDLHHYYRNRSESGSSSRRNRLENLIWLREINNETCTESSWRKYLDILERFESRRLNLVPYIIQSKDDLATHCENQAGSNWYSTDIKTFLDLYYLTFSSRGTEVIGEERTLEYLKIMRGIIRNQNHSSLINKRNRIDKLLDISELTYRKCDGSSWDILTDIHDYFEIYELNILPYINFWTEKRESFCREMVEKEKSNNTASGLMFEQLYEKLFGGKAVQLGNETTRVMLRQLQMAINNREQQVSSSIRNNVDKLVSIGWANRSDCTRESYQDYLWSLEKNHDETINILPYLLYMKEEISRFCQERSEFNYFEQDPYDWKKIYEQIFSPNAQVLGPEKTLELLKQLQEIFGNRTDRNSGRKKVLIDRFVNISHLTGEKCSKESWYELLTLYDNYKSSTQNIKPFLNYWRLKLENHCVDKGDWYEADIGKWQEVENQLYDSSEEGVPIGNDETLEQLKYLHTQYSYYAEEYTPWKRRKLNELIEMSKMSRDKCNEKNNLIAQRVMNYNQDFIVNIMPYLKYWRNQQVKLCAKRANG